MKRILFTLLAVFSITTMYSQLDFSTEYYGTNIKKITEIKCDYVDRFGSYEKENCWTGSIKKFNTDGKIIENSSYDSLGKLEYKIIHKYDSDGYMYVYWVDDVDSSSSRYDPSFHKIESNSYTTEGVFMSKSLIKYDSNKNVMDLSSYGSDGSLAYKRLYKYDSDGNKIESSSYNSDGNLIEKDTYKYDSYGNKIESIYYNSDGNLTRKNIDKYDSYGNIIESSCYNSDGNLTRKNIDKYDSYGRHISSSSQDESGERCLRYTREYLSDSVEITRWYSECGIFESSWVFKIDSNGRVIDQSGYDSLDFLTYKETIEYNSNGEMIKIIRYKSEILIPLSFNEWIFEYYD